MHEFMRQQVSLKVMPVGIAEGLLRSAVVAGFMVLQPVMRGLVAERKQEVIFLVMARAEQLPSLGHKLFVTGQVFVGNLQRRIALRYHVDHVYRRFPRLGQLQQPVERTRNQWGIHQPRERHRLKAGGFSGLLRGRERGAEFPARRQPD